jgi:glycosyltransferase involved in cell wall biosynthesis
MGKVIIGAPVYNRAWILPYYIECIKRQQWDREDIGLVFIDGHSNDSSVSLIKALRTEGFWFVEIQETPYWQKQYTGDRNKQGSGRFLTLSQIRNQLLDFVVSKDPDFYLSWDTDILLPNYALSQLASYYKPVISPRVFLDRGEDCRNEMWWAKNFVDGERKPPYIDDTLHKADVIMAVKLFEREAYRISRYSYHPQGEDLGWAESMRRQGVELWVDPTIPSKHFLEEEDFKKWLKKNLNSI